MFPKQKVRVRMRRKAWRPINVGYGVVCFVPNIESIKRG